MCFTLSLQVEKHKLEKSLNAEFKSGYSFEPFYFVSAFDHPTVPVKTCGNTCSLTPMQWGLIPEWTKNVSDARNIRSKTLNARFETLFEKSSFRLSALHSRCIVPATGFFEWQHVGNMKIPWFIAFRNNEIMQMAGIYSSWTNFETGEVINTFSIITLPANPLLEKIHNTKKRMPAILKPNEAGAWLNKNIKAEEYLNIIKPIEQDYLKAYTVSPVVSNPKNNRNIPEVIKPYNYPEQQLLF